MALLAVEGPFSSSAGNGWMDLSDEETLELLDEADRMRVRPGDSTWLRRRSHDLGLRLRLVLLLRRMLNIGGVGTPTPIPTLAIGQSLFDQLFGLCQIGHLLVGPLS